MTHVTEGKIKVFQASHFVKSIMPIYRLGNRTPKIHPSAFIADNATIIGDVVIKAHASVWFNVVIRADNDRITIGENSNIQDGSVLHADPGYPVTVGKNVTVGHMAMLHGCTIGDGTMIGIRATVLNGSVIAENSLVGAGTLIAENKNFKPGVVLLGVPARIARTMDEKTAARMPRAASHYVWNKQRFEDTLVGIDRPEAGNSPDKEKSTDANL
jgi:carbonic anhydrase/acetyltransferase-like protein (isoleucine patch superfamily)